MCVPRPCKQRLLPRVVATYVALALEAPALPPVPGKFWAFSRCELALEAKPKTVLLIVIDTLRADHLGCYGGKSAATPTIDALAARGVRFDNAACPTPLTRPSISSMPSARRGSR